MVTLLFDGLTQFDPTASFSPGWQIAGPRTAKASGTSSTSAPVSPPRRPTLVAADVKRSFLRVLNPQDAWRSSLAVAADCGCERLCGRARARDVRGIEVLGDTAVAFTLTEPLAIFPKFLAMPVASVAPSPVPAEFGQRPVGTGPWRFVAWQHDDYLRFVRNPSYWGGASLSESLTVRIIPEALTRAAEFLAGRISSSRSRSARRRNGSRSIPTG